MSNIFSAVCTVVRDAEVRYLQSGSAVLNVTVANNIGYGDKQKTLFIRCALFGKRAEGQLKDYLVKGQQVMVSGELSENEYQANDGTTKKSIDLNANIIDLVGGKRESTGQSQPAQKIAAQQKPSDNFDGFDDTDIPF
jgi:single-strand DNA-binding protein